MEGSSAVGIELELSTQQRIDKISPLREPSSAMSRLRDPNSLKFFVHLWKTGSFGSMNEFALL